MTLHPGPLRVAHIDWSVSPRKRWWTAAAIGRDGRVRVEAPCRFDASALRELGIGRIADTARETRTIETAHARHGASPPLLLGFDFSIGLPRHYARKIGVDSFRDFLRQWSSGRWPEWDRIAESAEQISLERPFYPQSSRGGVRQTDLLDAHGVSELDALRRECERGRPDRRAASPLFWTLGAQQVGRGSLAGWREILLPLLGATWGNRAASHPIGTSIWPFDGPLRSLVENSRVTISEAYPTQFHRSLGLDLKGGKRRAATRVAQASALLNWAERNDVLLSPKLEAAIAAGFPVAREGEAAGEDPFDSVVGLFGMLDVVAGRRSEAAPFERSWLAVEGWILGCPVD